MSLNLKVMSLTHTATISIQMKKMQRMKKPLIRRGFYIKEEIRTADSIGA